MKWLMKILEKKLWKKKQEVIKLQWQRAELEATLQKLKRGKQEHED